MSEVNGALAPGTELDVVDVVEQSPMSAYLEASRLTCSRIIDELTDLRDSEQALEVELTRQAGEARARRMNYQRALEALGKPETKRRAAGPTSARKHNWQPTEAKVAEVEARVRALLPKSPHEKGGVTGVTAAYIARETPGLTPESAKKALEVLRQREVVRVVGPVRGGGVLFTLMPEAAGAT